MQGSILKKPNPANPPMSAPGRLNAGHKQQRLPAAAQMEGSGRGRAAASVGKSRFAQGQAQGQGQGGPKVTPKSQRARATLFF